jgi:hypothetical protein
VDFCGKGHSISCGCAVPCGKAKKQGRRVTRLPCEKPHNSSSIYCGGEEVNREEAKSVFFEASYKRKALISCILRIVKQGRCAILKIPEEKRKR